MEELKKGTIQQEIKDYKTNKKVGELLSTNLSDVKEKFKTSEDGNEQVFLSIDESFNQYKENYEKSMDVIVPEVECIGSDILTSAMLMHYEEHMIYLKGVEFDSNLIESFKESVSEVQVVVAAGPDCRQVKIGDLVRVRLDDFVRVKNPNSVNRMEVNEVPLLVIDNNNYLSMHERNIQFIFKTEGYHQRRECMRDS